ncbi:hypothetical protein FS842_009943, partial [Serendipita sp. 407]
MATNNTNIQGPNAPPAVNVPGAQGGAVGQAAPAQAVNVPVAPAIDQEFETEWEEAHRE